MSLLTSHMWWVHQDAILVGQSQSSMWMWQQATGTPLTEHISYVTCSLVPLDLSSSRIKFWRVLRQWQLLFNQAQRSSKYGVLSNCTGHLPKKLSDLAVVLLCWQWRLLLAPRTCSCVQISLKGGTSRCRGRTLFTQSQGGWTAAAGAQDDLLGFTKKMLEFLFLFAF